MIADSAVERDFGTGAVKVTPAHDPTDYEIGLRHELPMPSVLDLRACISGEEIDVGPYAGLDRYAAREAIVRALRDAGLLLEERPHHHAVSVSERTGDVIEPLLSLQWFVNMKPLAQPALEAYRDGRLRFVPERYGRTYEQWLENIRDWNISRQVWWGHQLPVWYTPSGDVVVAQDEREAHAIARERYGSEQLTRDPDTLDTWFSSGLWPFSILGWPARTPELEHWYPAQVLVTGWEIIFLWVARMVMLGLKFMGRVPFPEVFIAPLVFDAQGRKMSKSLGNAIDPLDLVDRYGADAFRLGMMRQMRLEGQEVRFNESRCEEARNFNNKIWNATRYVLSLPEGLPPALRLPSLGEMTLADRWVLARLHATVTMVSGALDRYDFGAAAESVWRFVWYEFCDWYVEASKSDENRSTRGAVLSFVLNNAMRLLHPIEPFITEEVWLLLPHDGTSIVTASWPDPAEIPFDREAHDRFDALRAAVERLRNERAEQGIASSARAPIEFPVLPDGDATLAYARDLVLRLVHGETTSETRDAAPNYDGFLQQARVRVSAAESIRRLRKERDRLRSEVERGEKKLANEQFIAKAAPDVVAKEREKLERYREELASTDRRLVEMGANE